MSFNRERGEHAPDHLPVFFCFSKSVIVGQLHSEVPLSISSYPSILLRHTSPLHVLLPYIHDPPLGWSFPPAWQLHLYHPLSRISTLLPLHMCKPPNLSDSELSLCWTYFLYFFHHSSSLPAYKPKSPCLHSLLYLSCADPPPNHTQVFSLVLDFYSASLRYIPPPAPCTCPAPLSHTVTPDFLMQDHTAWGHSSPLQDMVKLLLDQHIWSARSQHEAKTSQRQLNELNQR